MERHMPVIVLVIGVMAAAGCAGSALLGIVMVVWMGTDMADPLDEPSIGMHEMENGLVARNERPGTPDKTLRGRVDPEGGGDDWLFTVPDDAVHAVVALDGGEIDVDIYASFHGRGGEPPGMFDWSATSIAAVEELHLSRMQYPELWGAVLRVRVVAAETGTGRDGLVPYELEAQFHRPRAAADLSLGQATDLVLDPDGGWRRDVTVQVPAGTGAIRLDLTDVDQDLDLFASFDAPVSGAAEAAFRAETGLARESLVIPAEAVPPAGGVLHVAVVDAGILDDPVRARLVTTAGSAPPPEVAILPDIPTPPPGRDRAIAAVVEVLAGTGSGSGVIVHRSGLVLTNHHVVADDAGAVTEDGEVVIALTLDPARPPRELFRARPVLWDESLDLALLRIESDLFGRPVHNLALPHLETSPDLPPDIGDTLITVGFPGVGGWGTRVAVMYDVGVVGGFDPRGDTYLIKSSASMAHGSSGGAALDADHRLVGLPTFVHNDGMGGSSVGYVVPMDALPEGWAERIVQGPEDR